MNTLFATKLASAVTGLHRALVKYDLLTGFATLFVGVYDQRRKSLSYVNCGQEPGLIFRTATNTVKQMPPAGPVLGGFSTGGHEEKRVPLASGDVIVLFTDGLNDVGQNRKKLLGVEGVWPASSVLFCRPTKPEHRRGVLDCRGTTSH